MAFRRDPSTLSTRTVVLWLALFVLLALTLRVAFNADVAFDEDSGRYLYSGNDPWYHDKTVHSILDTGQSVIYDPDIKYPDGRQNPNPPLYDWTTAPIAGALMKTGMDQTTAVSLALNSMVALWGALTVIPVFLIGRTLWGDRAGLWAGFLMAVSAPHIDRSAFGFADHDATTMFFITLAVAFLMNALRNMDHREYVSDWRHGDARWRGIKASFAHNRQAYLWSFLSGVALSATAVTWKGYPYIIAVMALAVFLHLLLDHARNLDSTATFGIYFLPLLLVSLVPLPYYLTLNSFIDTTMVPVFYVLLGVLAVGLILVPTRDLPSILVFPGLAVAAIIGLLVLRFAFTDVWTSIFTGLGYFQQSKLYTTIAEAQRSSLGVVAASFGFFTFLLAFWTFGRSVRNAWRGQSAHILMVAWAVVALFMAFAASRFMMNAAPVFAVLSGGAVAILVSKLGLSDMRRRYRARHGQGVVKSSAAAMNWRSTMGLLMIAVLIVLPNAWLGVDAGMSSDFEFENDLHEGRLVGAFGIGFSIRNNGWLEAMSALAERDTDVPMAERPAQIAWWDYGHWATAIGKHPTVADPFQSNFNIAGRFLASESEGEAVMWMTLLIANTDHRDGQYSPAVEEALRAHDPGLLAIGPTRGYDGMQDVYEQYVDRESEEVYDLYDEVSAAAGKHIGYMAADDRMWPTQRNPGIFYAPTFLANKDPDDFVRQLFVTQNEAGQQMILTQDRYGVDENNNSFALQRPVFRDEETDTTWEVAGGRAFPEGALQRGGHDGFPGQFQIQPTQRFEDSMYRRAFGGISVAQHDAPGEGLTHWRAVHQSTRGSGEQEGRQVVLLEYYSGARVSGAVEDENGAPVEGAEVTFVDGFGAGHAVASTDADGRFTVRAPFSEGDDLRLSVRIDDSEVVSRDDVQFTRQQAREGASEDIGALVVELTDLSGRVFRDLDGDGAWNETDEAIDGALVAVDDRNTTTAADGTYTLRGLRPGEQTVHVTKVGYLDPAKTVDLPAGEDVQEDIQVAAAPTTVEVTYQEQDSTPIEGVPVQFQDPDGEQVTSGRTDEEGVATSQEPLQPGEYVIVIDHTRTEDGIEVTYNEREEITVAFGGGRMEVTITRSPLG